jgi:4-hydroxybenzoyl-CoA thioesterase
MAKFERTLTVEWGDCDEAGIVFYPNYFYWFDSTFHAMMRDKNVSQRIIRAKYGVVTPLVDVGASFHSPVRYDDVIVIEAEIVLWAERRFRIAYKARSGERVVAMGHEERAWALLSEDGKLKAATIPEDFKALFLP